MIEIAICLAIIGVALVGIIGVLPYGMNTQRANREETVIGQDANVLMPLIKAGAQGADDLTNYVYAIVNTGSNPMGYTNALAGQMGFKVSNFPGLNWQLFLTNGANIVGLLTTPEYVDANNAGRQIPGMNYGGISNHIYAFVRSISGLAAEKPPQNNSIMVGDSFAYRIFCVNAPVPFDTNLLSGFQLWQPQAYPTGSQVLYDWNVWQAASPGATPADVPGVPAPPRSNPWFKVPFYPLELSANQHDMRLTFGWPILPSGFPGSGRQTFRQAMSGSMATVNNGGTVLFYLRDGLFQQN